MTRKVIKRDNKTLVDYNSHKIRDAVRKANLRVDMDSRASDEDIKQIIQAVDASKQWTTRSIGDSEFATTILVEEIQDIVERELMILGKFALAKEYITYRFKRAMVRRSNTTDDSILALLKNDNAEVEKENSNKKAKVNSTKRDLIAGEVSKDLTKRYLLPEKIVEAHEKGILHFHDMDYFMQDEFNCCLPNFRDMLENGTTIHGVMIESPKSFRVACNQVTQMMADISSNQYGGQTFYADILGKYLALTRDKFEKRIRENLTDSLRKNIAYFPDEVLEEAVKSMVDEELKIELKAGIQCIQYQINTLMTTNGFSRGMAVVKSREPLPSGCERKIAC